MKVAESTGNEWMRHEFWRFMKEAMGFAAGKEHQT
jgi:hypothetical protein